MKLYSDNKSTINIAHNPVQHNHIKHVEINKHFIKEKLNSGLIYTLYVSTRGQLVDILTKGLVNHSLQATIDKLGMENIYSLTKGLANHSLQPITNKLGIENIYSPP